MAAARRGGSRGTAQVRAIAKRPPRGLCWLMVHTLAGHLRCTSHPLHRLGCPRHQAGAHAFVGLG